MGFETLGLSSQDLPNIFGTAIVDEPVDFTFRGHIPNVSVDELAAPVVKNA